MMVAPIFAAMRMGAADSTLAGIEGPASATRPSEAKTDGGAASTMELPRNAESDAPVTAKVLFPRR
ncbi:MAG TPA: hypothetical protein VFD71_11750, partial [Planctomycetota bacterium]|nr:hypothetical protein [Planctomycetota bacterium]